MTIFQILLLIFLLVPILEIYLLIHLGGLVGVIPTIILVVFTAVLGAALVRIQGIATLYRIQETLARKELPATALFEGAFLLVAGALLLTPGFFTDAVGFLCLVPPFRQGASFWLLNRFRAKTTSHTQSPGGPRVIEGEFRRED
ncbi:MAG: FxsA family protein [Gammaproteobacteria bacterium]|nr:FxsA family protein [Gammaproteobacteria bacterium]